MGTRGNERNEEDEGNERNEGNDRNVGKGEEGKTIKGNGR